MTKRKTRKPADPPAEPESAGMAPAEEPAAVLSLDPADFDGILAQALAELAVNVPYYDARLVGNRLELHLYGGQVRTWPEED